jgi:hypothetical protein
LCAKCLGKFQQLRFDEKARCGDVLIPFNSLVWEDEEPPLDEGRHKPCLSIIIRLFTVRRRLWQTGRVPAEMETFWKEARVLLPDWPGFRRLTLSVKEKAALAACNEETDEIMESFRKESQIFAVTDGGGGVIRFVAHPMPTESGGDGNAGTRPVPGSGN